MPFFFDGPPPAIIIPAPASVINPGEAGILPPDQSALLGMVGKSRYVANAVNFDGTNDYLLRGADLTGNADGKVGTFSCWINVLGGNGTIRVVLSNASGLAALSLNASNLFTVDMYTSGVSGLLRIHSSAIASGSGWKNILSSWDLAAQTGYLRVNDVDDTSFYTGPTNGIIDYTRADYGVGARTDGTKKWDGDLADVWFDPTTYLAPTEANRRKFITASGKPVSLGLDGSKVTGSAPLVFMSGATASWHTNKGGGGGFTETGTLTAADSSPSD